MWGRAKHCRKDLAGPGAHSWLLAVWLLEPRSLAITLLPRHGELVAKWSVSLKNRTETHLKTGTEAYVQKRTIPTLGMRPLLFETLQ